MSSYNVILFILNDNHARNMTKLHIQYQQILYFVQYRFLFQLKRSNKHFMIKRLVEVGRVAIMRTVRHVSVHMEIVPTHCERTCVQRCEMKIRQF